MALKKAEIREEISLIDPKNVKMGDFFLNNRKIFPYFPRIERYSVFNGKIYAYFYDERRVKGFLIIH